MPVFFEKEQHVLTHNIFGLNACSGLLKHENIVTRSFLTSSKSFKRVRRGGAVPLGISDV